MKKLLGIIILLIPALVIASSSENAISPFPNAKPGINILPLSEINMPMAMKNEIIKNKMALATKGFNETIRADQSIISLFTIQKTASLIIKQSDNSKDPYDTNLKSSLSKLKLAFPFNGVPGIEKNNVLGFAAAGGYQKDKGWDGVVEFFTDLELGVCSFTTYKIASVMLDKETIEFFVNNKPSNKSVAGNWNTGFLYVVNWYASTRLMELQCANKKYNKSVLDREISLAKAIDNDNKI